MIIETTHGNTKYRVDWYVNRKSESAHLNRVTPDIPGIGNHIITAPNDTSIFMLERRLKTITDRIVNEKLLKQFDVNRLVLV